MRIISAPFVVEGNRISVRACAGIAVYPGPGYRENLSFAERALEITKAADVALIEAKTYGSGSVCLYSPDLDDRIRNSVVLEQGLHQALEDRQFDLHFQPIVDLETGYIVAAEALVRWQHPTLGLQRPDQFIPIAEATGQIIPLGAWILEEALARLNKWSMGNDDPPRLAVNVSGVQLKDPGFFDFVSGAIIASGIDPKKLELELTETAIVDCTPNTLDKLADLRAMGVTIAIDDFGTGYSSFRYLSSLPIDKIKIDQTFVRRMVVNSSDAAIVKGIIAIARDLSLRVVVEGIETVEQRDFLKGEGCEVGQGYLFSMPLLEDDFIWMFLNKIKLPLINDSRNDRVEMRPIPAD